MVQGAVFWAAAVEQRESGNPCSLNRLHQIEIEFLYVVESGIRTHK